MHILVGVVPFGRMDLGKKSLQALGSGLRLFGQNLLWSQESPVWSRRVGGSGS